MSFYPSHPNCQVKDLPIFLEKYLGCKTNGRFVEVGAFNGYNWSNTYPLAALGWTGLYIEPQPEYFAECRQRHSVHPNVTCHQLACSNKSGIMKLYLGGSVSTIKEETVAAYSTLPEFSFCGLDLTKFIEVNVVRLESLLVGWPAEYDLLVIDVEGAEMDVIEGAGLFDHRPSMLIIETHEQFYDPRLSRKGPEVDECLLSMDYVKIHSDTINSIYVDKGIA